MTIETDKQICARVSKDIWDNNNCLLSDVRELMERLLAADAKLNEPVGEYVDIVFDGPPSHESGRFVEVENHDGRSINFGEWIHRPDGYWVLRIKAMRARVPEDTALLDWADREGHYDVRYESLRDELRLEMASSRKPE